MKPAKEKQLLKLLINVCKGTRVGPDLELAEVAARHEARLKAELQQLETAESEPEHARAA